MRFLLLFFVTRLGGKLYHNVQSLDTPITVNITVSEYRVRTNNMQLL